MSAIFSPKNRPLTLLLAGMTFCIGIFFASLSWAETTAEAKCPVCQGGKHPHTKQVKCSDVNDFIAKHPGSVAGECGTVSHEKPPKPTPTPKPPKPTPTPKPPKSLQDSQAQQQ